MMRYQALLGQILQYGTEKGDRTGTGTKSVFGHQMRFDLTESFPLVTTKRVFFRGVVEELLWMLRGDTNVRSLQAAGVTIWDEWADERGDLGPVYGEQWRSWAKCSQDTCSATIQTIDQITLLLEQLRTNPDSRRLIVSAWNPSDLDRMALAPCHCLFQFNTRPASIEQRLEWAVARSIGDRDWRGLRDRYDRKTVAGVMDTEEVPSRFLDCQLYQRSADVFLGVPFNIASYALLTHMIAQVAGMVAGDFVWTGGDVHLYANHFDQAREQLSRETRKPPQIRLNPDVKDLFSFTAADIELIGYDPLSAIKAEVAV